MNHGTGGGTERAAQGKTRLVKGCSIKNERAAVQVKPGMESCARSGDCQAPAGIQAVLKAPEI